MACDEPFAASVSACDEPFGVVGGHLRDESERAAWSDWSDDPFAEHTSSQGVLDSKPQPSRNEKAFAADTLPAYINPIARNQNQPSRVEVGVADKLGVKPGVAEKVDVDGWPKEPIPSMYHNPSKAGGGSSGNSSGGGSGGGGWGMYKEVGKVGAGKRRKSGPQLGVDGGGPRGPGGGGGGADVGGGGYGALYFENPLSGARGDLAPTGNTSKIAFKPPPPPEQGKEAAALGPVQGSGQPQWDH